MEIVKFLNGDNKSEQISVQYNHKKFAKILQILDLIEI